MIPIFTLSTRGTEITAQQAFDTKAAFIGIFLFYPPKIIFLTGKFTD
jgi:hypothetical protein